MEVKTLTLKAKRIVAVPTGRDTWSIVCFEFDHASYEDARKLMGRVVDVTLEDTNGSFTSEGRRFIAQATIPGWMNGAGDVMIVETQRVREAKWNIG